MTLSAAVQKKIFHSSQATRMKEGEVAKEGKGGVTGCDFNHSVFNDGAT